MIGAIEIMSLTSGQEETERVAECIDECVDLCSTHRVIARWLDPPQLFLSAGAMLMSAHDGAVDHRIFIVSLCGEVLEHAFPNAGDGPAAEASLHMDPIPKTLRQVTPRDPGPIAVEHSLDKQPRLLLASGVLRARGAGSARAGRLME